MMSLDVEMDYYIYLVSIRYVKNAKYGTVLVIFKQLFCAQNPSYIEIDSLNKISDK